MQLAFLPFRWARRMQSTKRWAPPARSLACPLGDGEANGGLPATIAEYSSWNQTRRGCGSGCSLAGLGVGDRLEGSRL